MLADPTGETGVTGDTHTPKSLPPSGFDCGLTLLELLVVIAIIGVLSALFFSGRALGAKE
jgi:prepilin-type N-terminal cleavage/methylation domain-containing protein